jgi:4-amino-4-deoxy-L-arabinose transferase-like glycosyltransferase
MAAAGDWVVPVHDGKSYLQKPPLLYWLILLSYDGFGIHDWAARMVPCSAALGTILVTFWWGSKASGFRAGLLGAFILCLSPRFLHQSRMITMDGLLGLWVVSGLSLGHLAIRSGRINWTCWLLSAATCGLGILTKGPVALLLVAAPLLVYQFVDRRTARPRGWAWPAFLGTAGALAVPWFLAVSVRDHSFLQEFFWTHHVVMRFLRPLHEEPAWFYLPVLLLGMMPWTLLLPSAVRDLFCRSGPAGQSRPPELGFFLLCSLGCLLFFSLASCKRIGYILPAMPTLALTLGCTLDRQLHGRALSACFLPPARMVALWNWATPGVLAAGIVGAMIAILSGLVKPVGCLIIVSLLVGALGWFVSWGRRQTWSGSWAACAVSTFALLFLALQIVLPGYHRRFSVRAQVRSLMATSNHRVIPVICYPHYCDSVSFYLGRQDVRPYGAADRARLIEDLKGCPESLAFVKSGRPLQELLTSLPDAIEFVPRGRSSWVTSGLLRQRTQLYVVSSVTATPARDP